MAARKLRDVPQKDRMKAVSSLETCVSALQVIIRDLRDPREVTAEQASRTLSQVRSDIGTAMARIGK